MKENSSDMYETAEIQSLLVHISIWIQVNIFAL